MRLGVFLSVAIYCFEGALELISAKTHGYQIGIRSLLVRFHALVAQLLFHNSLWSLADQLLCAGETGSVPAHIGLIHVWTWLLAEPIYQKVLIDVLLADALIVEVAFT